MGTTELTKKFQKELNAGTTALVLLGVLNGSEGPMYGYQIARHIESGSDGALLSRQGAMYPVLRALEASGLLESYIEPSTSGPARRYYRITGEGRKVLEEWRGIWKQTQQLVDGVLQE